MILLDKKSYRLLSYLVELQEPETVMAISKKLNQSRRKIYYHLEKINEALPAEVEQIISYPRVGILLNARQKAVCQELLDELDDYSYVMSIEERLQLTLTYIAISKERVTIEKLMSLHDVSRNTILNDLNDIRRKLSNEEYDINLRVTMPEAIIWSVIHSPRFNTFIGCFTTSIQMAIEDLSPLSRKKSWI